MAKPPAIPQPDLRAKRLRTLYHRAKIARSNYDKHWERDLRWLMGDQYTPVRHEWMANSVTNKLFEHTFTIVPFVANRFPDVQAEARNEMDLESMVLSILINRALGDNQIIERNEAATVSLVALGPAYWHLRWDKQLNGGHGRIVIEDVDPREIYLQPGKMHHYDAHYMFRAKRVDKVTLLSMYPDKRDIIDHVFRKHDGGGPGPAPTAGDGYAGEGGRATAAGSPASDESVSYVYATADTVARERDSVELVIAHFKDETMMEVELDAIDREGKDGPSTKKIKKAVRAFPNGHCVAFVDQFVLDDRPEPFPGFPYASAHNYHLPGMPYSLGDIAVYRGLQLLLNQRNNQAHDGLERSFGRQIFADSRSDLNQDEVSWEPEEIINVDSVEGIKIADRTSVPPGAFESAEIIKRDLSDGFGVEDVLRGGVPGDVRSGFAIEQLQSGAANKMKLKTRALESMILQAAHYMTWMIAKQYRAGREYSETLGDGTKIDLNGIAPYLFDWRVRAGTNLRATTQADQQFFLMMHSRGTIDDEYLVRYSDMPGKLELITRMKPIWDARREQVAAQAAGSSPSEQGGVA